MNADTPIACTLGDANERRLRETAVDDLVGRAEAIEELPDGYALRYADAERELDALLAFVRAERRCCPFFTFELVFEPDEGPVWLRLRGSAEIKAFMQAAFLSGGANLGAPA